MVIDVGSDEFIALEPISQLYLVGLDMKQYSPICGIEKCTLYDQPQLSYGWGYTWKWTSRDITISYDFMTKVIKHFEKWGFEVTNCIIKVPDWLGHAKDHIKRMEEGHAPQALPKELEWHFKLITP